MSSPLGQGRETWTYGHIAHIVDSSAVENSRAGRLDAALATLKIRQSYPHTHTHIRDSTYTQTNEFFQVLWSLCTALKFSPRGDCTVGSSLQEEIGSAYGVILML